MADIQEIQSLYKKPGSIREVSHELKISRNTVRKSLRTIQEIQEGVKEEIPLENQLIIQPKRVVNEELVRIVTNYLEENQEKPKKQRLSAAEIHRLVQSHGFQVYYSTIKSLVDDWKENHSHHEVFVLQDPP